MCSIPAAASTRRWDLLPDGDAAPSRAAEPGPQDTQQRRGSGRGQRLTGHWVRRFAPLAIGGSSLPAFFAPFFPGMRSKCTKPNTLIESRVRSLRKRPMPSAGSALTGVVGQIALGHLSDRLWSGVGLGGCGARALSRAISALLLLPRYPTLDRPCMRDRRLPRTAWVMVSPR